MPPHNKGIVDEIWASRWTKMAVKSGAIFLTMLAIAGILNMVLGIFDHLRDILIPLFLAFLFAYILDPVVDFIEHKMRLPRMGAVLTIVGAVILVLAIIFGIAIPEASHQSNKLADTISAKVNAVESSVDEDGTPNAGRNSLLKWIENKIPAEVGDEVAKHQKKMMAWTGIQLGNLGGIVARGIGFVVTVVVFAIVMIYLLRDFDTILDHARGLLPMRHRARILYFVGQIDESLRNFFRGQLTVCFIMAIMYTIGLLICGVPLALLLGLVAGFANIIPYMGVVIGAVPAILLAASEHGLDWHPLGVIVVFVFVQFIEGNVITPKIVGDKVGLNPTVIILAILVCGKFLGFLGVLLAVPIAAVAKVFVAEGLDKYQSSKFFKGPQSRPRRRPSRRPPTSRGRKSED
ncbi:AI-2E family transporter [Candidatus Hydrogenedentota bacterium]